MQTSTNSPRKPAVAATPNQPQFSSGRCAADQAIRPFNDAREYAIGYVQQNPESAAMWCFGLGFLLAWRLRG